MAENLIDEGLTLMLVGMGTVFVFLTVLVGATTLMSRFVMRIDPGSAAGGDSDEEIAAIAAAITAHRRK